MSLILALAVTARILQTAPPAVELTNTGSQPVTAWSFAVVSPNPQGGTHRELHTADVYLSEVTRDLPRSPQHLDWLQPGKSVRVPVDAAPRDASVEVVAVVFADRTADGDAKTIQALFDHRRGERDQLRDVSEILNGTLKTGRGVAALHAIDDRLAALGDADSVPLRTAREAVAAFLGRAVGTSGGDDAVDQQIRQYAAFVTKQYALAAAHAEPR